MKYWNFRTYFETNG